MKSTIFFLLCLVAYAASGAVDDMLGTIKILEGQDLKLDVAWTRSIPLGHITSIIFSRNKLDLNPENIEVIADASGVTIKATNMGFVFAGKARADMLIGNKNFEINITGKIDNFERKYAYGAPLEIVAKDCSIQISNKRADVDALFNSAVEAQINNHVNDLMCTHLYFVGSIITTAVNEMGFGNLKQKSGKGAAGIRAMFGR